LTEQNTNNIKKYHPQVQFHVTHYSSLTTVRCGVENRKEHTFLIKIELRGYFFWLIVFGVPTQFEIGLFFLGISLQPSTR
jgi:hypothetical protein